ncbi:MAG: hypothetical protein FWC32_01265 [Firmicutes bacterium]|nr:hypothetical protein [Bacillota bacterium]
MNKKRKKMVLIIGTIAAIVLIIALAPVFIFMYRMGTPWQGIRRTETDFLRNKERIIIVRDYLIISDYESITICPTREPGTMFVGLEHGHLQISNPEVVEAVASLFNNGYQVIRKSANAVILQRWSGFDAGRGVVYSIDGQTPGESALSFLTRIEPLSIEGWYYYEDDFNEWRRR